MLVQDAYESKEIDSYLQVYNNEALPNDVGVLCRGCVLQAMAWVAVELLRVQTAAIVQFDSLLTFSFRPLHRDTAASRCAVSSCSSRDPAAIS